MHLEKYVKSLELKFESAEGALDIVVFGSSVKGSVAPNDLDALVVCADGADITRVRRAFDGLPEEVQLKFVKLGELVETHTLLKQAAVHEGHSVRLGMPVREALGFESHTLFTFSLTNLQQTGKVKFQYALYGRGSREGVLGSNGGRGIAPGAVLVPVEKESDMEAFFKEWGAEYSKERWMAAVR